MRFSYIAFLYFLSFGGFCESFVEYFDVFSKHDRVYFLCETQQGKYIAFYGDVDKNDEPISLYYLYGSKNNPEFVYPSSNTKNNLMLFENRYYSRPLTNYLFILFKNEDYNYTFKYSSEDDVRLVTLDVSYMDKDEGYYFSCKEIKVNKLYAIARYLPCNKNEDEPIGCLKN